MSLATSSAAVIMNPNKNFDMLVILHGGNTTATAFSLDSKCVSTIHACLSYNVHVLSGMSRLQRP